MELEQLIRSRVIFKSTSSAGFNMVPCVICQESSGQARLGIKLEYGNVGAHCFNCGYVARYNESDGFITNKFKKLLLAFDIDEDDINKCLAVNFINSKKDIEKNITLESIKKLNLSTPEVSLPEGAVLLRTAPDSQTKQKLIAYIESRKFSIDSYPWHFIPDSFKDDYLKNRIIIPYYRNNRIIYWQARSINSFVKKRYLNCVVQKAAVIFGYDELYSWTNKPLFITEGVFDAISIGGVCLLGSVLSDEMLSILQKTRRRVIFVIDKDGQGKKLATQVIEHNWEISFCPVGTSDVNDSIIKNGKLFTVYSLLTNTSKGFVAKTKVNMLCKGK